MIPSALARDPLTWLYPPIEPYVTGRIKVSALHDLYYEECGNPSGMPVIFIHGGPGGGVGPEDRRYFNPREYRIILLDQRGSGKSLPAACLEENTTWDLVADIEKLRELLGIGKWLAFGGSWGSTLALAYAQTHPERVVGLVLRGIFLLRKKEIDWFYQKGADAIFPDAWETYRDYVPASEQSDFLKAYHQRLTSPDRSVQLSAAKAWTTWEMATSRLYTPPELISNMVTDDFALKFARIECHYFLNKGFFKEDNHLLNQISTIRHIPTTIVQGRYDVVCPMMSAWELHKAFPEAEFTVVHDAGHSARETSMAKALVAATDRFLCYF